MTKTEQHESECGGMPGPGPEHKLLDPFVGRFKATVKLWMGPGDPMVSTGTMVNAWELGGRFLQQVYKGDPGPGPFPNFEGRGYWGFNTVTRKYEGMWIDTACTFMQNEVGTVDGSGKVWTMIGEMADPSGSGKNMTKRSVIKLMDKDRHSMEMYFTMPGAPEQKSMEIQYVRAK